MKGVYIHIPFCKKICYYCDFCKILYIEKYIDKYLESLSKEINDRYTGDTVKTIYIGGGSPSSLSYEETKKLLDIVKRIKHEDDYEYTIECNPQDIDIKKLKLYKEYGINRISIGVESFDKDNLRLLGRDYQCNITNNINLVKEYFNNINIDLIYGVNENIDIVKKDIDTFLKLDLPHISCYSLILEEHTKLFIDKHNYIEEDIDNKMYEYIKSTLKNNGYNHYEISNYSKDSYESVHNKIYWHNLEYYGFGLGAVSYLDNKRISNTKNFTKYLEGKFTENIGYEDINEAKENTLILGLRLVNGIKISEYNKRFNDDIMDKKVIQELINKGYLETDKEYLRIKEEYLYQENSILSEFIGSEL